MKHSKAVNKIFGRYTKRYSELTVQVKASLWFAVCNVLQKGISFFTLPLLTRLMPTAEYGEYSVFLSWYQIIGIFATLWLWNYTLNNGMIKFEDDRNGYLSALQGLSAACTVGLFIIYLPFSSLWKRATSLSLPIMALMFAELLMFPSFGYWCGRERFEYRYKSVVAISLLEATVVPVATILFVLNGNDKGTAAIIGRTLGSTLVYMIPAALIAVKGKRFYVGRYWRFALHFSLPLIPHFLACEVLQQSDRIMIANLVSEEKAGIYSVAYSAAMVLVIVNNAIHASFIPYTYNALKQGDTSGVRRSANYILILVCGLNLALILAAPEAIRLLAPAEYWEAMYIIPPVAMSAVFMFIFNLFANIEYYYEQTKYVAMASIGSAILNVILNAVFIPLFGYIAAGYTTLVCYVLYCCGHYFFMRIVEKKFMDGHKVYNGKAIVLILVLALLMAFGLLVLYDHPFIRYAIAVVAVVLCVFKREWILEQIRAIKKRGL